MSREIVIAADSRCWDYVKGYLLGERRENKHVEDGLHG